MLDRIAQRYGCRPSDLLAGTPHALTIDVRCCVVGAEEDERAARRK